MSGVSNATDGRLDVRMPPRVLRRSWILLTCGIGWRRPSSRHSGEAEAPDEGRMQRAGGSATRVEGGWKPLLSILPYRKDPDPGAGHVACTKQENTTEAREGTL